jgi:hypothetical protein
MSSYVPSIAASHLYPNPSPLNFSHLGQQPSLGPGGSVLRPVWDPQLSGLTFGAAPSYPGGMQGYDFRRLDPSFTAYSAARPPTSWSPYVTMNTGNPVSVLPHTTDDILTAYNQQLMNQNPQPSSGLPSPPSTTAIQPSTTDATGPASNIASASRPDTPDPVYHDAPQSPAPTESAFPVPPANEDQDDTSYLSASSYATPQTSVSTPQTQSEAAIPRSFEAEVSRLSSPDATSAFKESQIASSDVTAHLDPITKPSIPSIIHSAPDDTPASSTPFPMRGASPLNTFADLPPMTVQSAIPAPLFSPKAAPPAVDTTAQTPDAVHGGTPQVSESSLTSPLTSPYADETGAMTTLPTSSVVPPVTEELKSHWSDTESASASLSHWGKFRGWMSGAVSTVNEKTRPHGLDLERVGESVAAGTRHVGGGVTSLYNKGMSGARDLGHGVANTTNAAAAAIKSRLGAVMDRAGGWFPGSTGKSHSNHISNTGDTGDDLGATSIADPLAPATNDVDVKGLTSTAAMGLAVAGEGTDARNTAKSYWSNISAFLPKRFPRVSVPWGKSTQGVASGDFSRSSTAVPATADLDLSKPTTSKSGLFSRLGSGLGSMVPGLGLLRKSPTREVGVETEEGSGWGIGNQLGLAAALAAAGGVFHLYSQYCDEKARNEGRRRRYGFSPKARV